MVFSIFKSKRGRKPLDEMERKGRIAISLDPDLLEKLDMEPNKSELINNMLRDRYFPTNVVLQIANRLQHSLYLINQAFKSRPLLIPEIAELLGLEKAGILQEYVDGTNEPGFRFLEEYATFFGINTNWMKCGKGEPFLSTEQVELMATDYLNRIKELKPKVIYFIKADTQENDAGIVLKLDTYKYVYFPKTWAVSSYVGVTGQSQIYSLYKLIKKLQELQRCYSFESIGHQDFYCQSGTVSEKDFWDLFCGRVYPPSVIPFHNDCWWDDLTDVSHSWACAGGYPEKYGQEFLKAQEIIKSFVEAEQRKSDEQ